MNFTLKNNEKQLDKNVESYELNSRPT
ncbi:hypothetical protein XBI1_1620021 [Xenorhabdus bovienii str. Intermedium]|uniref:Uncharacterized protein n=1 Tax=Xenorhabdus bovienii str. Intermedium TaxID=1379677 RepID=A0A077QF21_XENBV|nr:hypothetical protein XBI1_1620021 [Xenorhabdus bovienii str. Intermedium]